MIGRVKREECCSATASNQLQRDTVSAAVTIEALEFLPSLFGKRNSPGAQMAARAARIAEETGTVVGSVTTLASELYAALQRE
jgi:hypothetical protein